MFSSLDYVIVRSGMANLPDMERTVLEMRFWRNATIDEIGCALRMSWREVEVLLASAFRKLKTYCLSDPDFTRAESVCFAA